MNNYYSEVLVSLINTKNVQRKTPVILLNEYQSIKSIVRKGYECKRENRQNYKEIFE